MDKYIKYKIKYLKLIGGASVSSDTTSQSEISTKKDLSDLLKKWFVDDFNGLPSDDILKTNTDIGNSYKKRIELCVKDTNFLNTIFYNLNFEIDNKKFMIDCLAFVENDTDSSTKMHSTPDSSVTPTIPNDKIREILTRCFVEFINPNKAKIIELLKPPVPGADTVPTLTTADTSTTAKGKCVGECTISGGKY
jgi:hypothetical protein